MLGFSSYSYFDRLVFENVGCLNFFENYLFGSGDHCIQVSTIVIKTNKKQESMWCLKILL